MSREKYKINDIVINNETFTLFKVKHSNRLGNELDLIGIRSDIIDYHFYHNDYLFNINDSVIYLEVYNIQKDRK